MQLLYSPAVALLGIYPREVKMYIYTKTCTQIPRSVQFNHSVVSDSLRPHGMQHARPPCPSPSPGAHSTSCPLSQWCHPTISSSDVPFSSRLQSFPASGSFQMSQFFASGGQSIKSFSFSISPSNEYSGLISFRIDWLDLLAVQENCHGLHRYINVPTITVTLFDKYKVH